MDKNLFQIHLPLFQFPSNFSTLVKPRPVGGGAGEAKYLGPGLVRGGGRNLDKTSGHCATVKKHNMHVTMKKYNFALSLVNISNELHCYSKANSVSSAHLFILKPDYFKS